MCISDWLRRTFSAFCQYLFTKIYILFIKIVTGSFLILVTILLFLSLMALPVMVLFYCSRGAEKGGHITFYKFS